MSSVWFCVSFSSPNLTAIAIFWRIEMLMVLFGEGWGVPKVIWRMGSIRMLIAL